MTHYDQSCVDSLTITDSYSRICAYIKNISEAGLVPNFDVYPSNTLIPAIPTAFSDTYITGQNKGLSNGFTSTDGIVHGVVKGLTEGVGVSDTIVKAFVRYLVEGGLLPETTLYPSMDLYPEGGIDVTDTIASGFSRWLADSCTVSDVISSFGVGKYSTESINILDSNIKAIGKYLGEVGTLPETTLYPANDFYPEGGISVGDVVNFGFFRWLSDTCTISDAGGINFGIGKNLSENVDILDVMLLSIGSYLEENINILDEILKHGNKSLSDTFKTEDVIVKHVMGSLSESTVVDDSIETILRTLVRAVISAIKADSCSLGLA